MNTEGGGAGQETEAGNMEQTREYVFGDMLLAYDTDEQGRISMRVIPAALRDRVLRKEYTAEPPVQIHARGDRLPAGYGNGHTLACTAASDAMKPVSQTPEGNTVITVLSDGHGRTVRHRVRWEEGLQALRVSARFENTGTEPVTLNLLSSVNLSGITPFTEGDAAGALVLHRIRSMWSAEGRLQSESIEEAMLERSWTGHALRLCKFGQKGIHAGPGLFPVRRAGGPESRGYLGGPACMPGLLADRNPPEGRLPEPDGVPGG